jgi:CRP-like cAMP-binding protein
MKKSRMKQKQDFVTASRWLQAVPKHLQEMLLRNAKSIRFDRDALVYELDDPPGGIFGVISGAIAIRTDDADQAVIYGHLLGPGAWFGEVSAILGAPRTVGATVVSDEAELVSVSLSAIEEMADRSPDLWRALAGLTAMSTQTAVQAARDLMIRNPHERCLAVLRRLSSSLGDDQDLPVSQDELAVMSALSRGSVSRILSELEAMGRIKRGYRSIALLDLGCDRR